MKIVLVDDNADAAVMLSMLLELEGHSVLLAFSGRSGIELICAAQPDMAIIDLGLPDFDGFEVVRTAKEAPDMSNCVFVMLTGRVDLDARRIAAEVGVEHFFTKGADISQLLSFVKHHYKSVIERENLLYPGVPRERTRV
jgi:DNA-binding response OmpR family regulator